MFESIQSLLCTMFYKKLPEIAIRACPEDIQTASIADFRFPKYIPTVFYPELEFLEIKSVYTHPDPHLLELFNLTDEQCNILLEQIENQHKTQISNESDNENNQNIQNKFQNSLQIKKDEYELTTEKETPLVIFSRYTEIIPGLQTCFDTTEFKEHKYAFEVNKKSKMRNLKNCEEKNTWNGTVRGEHEGCIVKQNSTAGDEEAQQKQTNTEKRMNCKSIEILSKKLSESLNSIDISEERQDERTTCMIKNIPNNYTLEQVEAFVNETHSGKFNFLYLRMDFEHRCNAGYAFVNFMTPADVRSFYTRIQGKRWSVGNSRKIAQLSYATIQGFERLVMKFRNSKIHEMEELFQPRIYHVEGPLAGQRRNWDELRDTCE